MRRYLWLIVTCLSAAIVAGPAGAGDLAFTFDIGPSFPVGAFGDKTGIIEPGESATYDATGGGAETGFGFDLGLEASLSPRISVGGVFSYGRYGADASDIVDKLVRPLEPTVSGIEAEWTATLLGGYVRVSAFESPDWRVYAKAGAGAAKMKNAFDVTFDIPDVGKYTITSDFDLGNKFYLSGMLGVEYELSEFLVVFTELGLRNFFFDGTEAAATAGEYQLSGTQRFDAQVFNLMFGVKIPLGGM
jgi:hypothetical protein